MIARPRDRRLEQRAAVALAARGALDAHAERRAVQLRGQPAAVEIEVAEQHAVFEQAPRAEPQRLGERARPADPVALDRGDLVELLARGARAKDHVAVAAGLGAVPLDVPHSASACSAASIAIVRPELGESRGEEPRRRVIAAMFARNVRSGKPRRGRARLRLNPAGASPMMAPCRTDRGSSAGAARWSPAAAAASGARSRGSSPSSARRCSSSRGPQAGVDEAVRELGVDGRRGRRHRRRRARAHRRRGARARPAARARPQRRRQRPRPAGRLRRRDDRAPDRAEPDGAAAAVARPAPGRCAPPAARA